MKSQKELVLQHLKKNHRITSYEAIMNYHATRLSDIIFKLRREGYPIFTDYEERKRADGRLVRYGVYKLQDLINL